MLVSAAFAIAGLGMLSLVSCEERQHVVVMAIVVGVPRCFRDFSSMYKLRFASFLDNGCSVMKSSSPSVFGGRFLPVDGFAVQSIEADTMHMSTFTWEVWGWGWGWGGFETEPEQYAATERIEQR